MNATEDPIIQLATSHTADEISYLKRVLDAMFETYNTFRQEVMAITSMEAVRLCKAPVENPRETQNGSATQGSAGQHLTMVQAEKVLKALVEEGWFEKSPRGFYSLSPRALMELRGWLLDTYNDPDDAEDDDGERPMRIKRCLACKEIITVVSVTRRPSCQEVIRLADSEIRVNDARNWHVRAGSMMCVGRVSFGRRNLLNVPCARRIGWMTISPTSGNES